MLAILQENGLSSPTFFQELAETLPDRRVRDRLVLSAIWLLRHRWRRLSGEARPTEGWGERRGVGSGRKKRS